MDNTTRFIETKEEADEIIKLYIVNKYGKQ